MKNSTKKRSYDAYKESTRKPDDNDNITDKKPKLYDIIYRNNNYGKLVISQYADVFEYNMKTAIYLHNQVHNSHLLNTAYRLFDALALTESPTVFMGNVFKKDMTEDFMPKYKYYKEFIKQVYPYFFSTGVCAYKYAWKSEIDSYIPVIIPLEKGRIFSVCDPINPEKRYYWQWTHNGMGKRPSGVSMNPSSTQWVPVAGQQHYGTGASMNDQQFAQDFYSNSSWAGGTQNGNVIFHDPDVKIGIMSELRDVNDNILDFVAVQVSKRSSIDERSLACEMLQTQFTSDFASRVIENIRYTKMMESQVEIETKKTKDSVYVELDVPFDEKQNQKFIELYSSERKSLEEISSNYAVGELFEEYNPNAKDRTTTSSSDKSTYARIPLDTSAYGGGSLGSYFERNSSAPSNYTGGGGGGDSSGTNLYMDHGDQTSQHIRSSADVDAPMALYLKKRNEDSMKFKESIINSGIDSKGIFSDPKITPDGQMTLGGPLHRFKFAPTASSGRSDLSDIVQLYRYDMASVFGIPAVHGMSSSRTTARGTDIDRKISDSKNKSVLNAITKILESVLNDLYTNEQVMDDIRTEMMMDSQMKLKAQVKRELRNHSSIHKNMIVVQDDYALGSNTSANNLVTDSVEDVKNNADIKASKLKQDQPRDDFIKELASPESNDPLSEEDLQMMKYLRYLSKSQNVREETTIHISFKEEAEVDLVDIISLYDKGLLFENDASLICMRQLNLDGTQTYKERSKLEELDLSLEELRNSSQNKNNSNETSSKSNVNRKPDPEKPDGGSGNKKDTSGTEKKDKQQPNK